MTNGMTISVTSPFSSFVSLIIVRLGIVVLEGKRNGASNGT